jgi:hypothetical protein
MSGPSSYGTPAAVRIAVLAAIQAKLAELIVDHGRPS